MKRYGSIAVAGIALALGASAHAGVVIDHDFTAGEGYVDGNLKWNNGWLGQDGQTVDSTAGTVTSGGAWLRNCYGTGAHGGAAGAAGDSNGPGFNVGDVFQIDVEMSLTLDTYGPGRETAIYGVTNGFADNGWNPAPVFGFKLDYNSWQDVTGGSVKLFGNKDSLDNGVALIVSGNDVGLDPFNTGDMVSDVIGVSATYEMTAPGVFTATELIFSNVDTATTLLTASIDKPGALEAQAYTGLEAYFASYWTRSAASTSTDSVRFEYIPVPEPASLALISLGGLCMLRRR